MFPHGQAPAEHQVRSCGPIESMRRYTPPARIKYSLMLRPDSLRPSLLGYRLKELPLVWPEIYNQVHPLRARLSVFLSPGDVGGRSSRRRVDRLYPGYLRVIHPAWRDIPCFYGRLSCNRASAREQRGVCRGDRKLCTARAGEVRNVPCIASSSDPAVSYRRGGCYHTVLSRGTSKRPRRGQLNADNDTHRPAFTTPTRRNSPLSPFSTPRMWAVLLSAAGRVTDNRPSSPSTTSYGSSMTLNVCGEAE